MDYDLDGLRQRREAIGAVAARHGARDVRVFGPVLHGETPEGIDLLVDMAGDRSLLDLAALWRDLEALLDHEVNLLTLGGLTDGDTGIVEEAVLL